MMRWSHKLAFVASALRASPGHALALSVGMGLVLAVPWMTWAVGAEVDAALTARTQGGPLVVAAPEDPYVAVMAGLFFQEAPTRRLSWADHQALEARPDLVSVPLHVHHTVAGARLVGTTLAYLEQRSLRMAEGRTPAVLGEAVVGAELARARGWEVGTVVPATTGRRYDPAAPSSLALSVVGVLARADSPDDGVVFVDLKTAWMLDGLIHGHAEVEGEAPPEIVIAEAFSQGTAPQVHPHGGPEDWPVDLVLAFGRTPLARDLLLADALDDPHRSVVRPAKVVRAVLGLVGEVQAMLAATAALVALCMGAVLAVLGAGVVRARSAELRLLRALGARPVDTWGLVMLEGLVYLGGAAALATVARTVLVGWWLGRWT